MKKLGKFMLGCLGLICTGLVPVVPVVASILLMSYISTWIAFTFIVTFPLSLYLVGVVLISLLSGLLELRFENKL